jgi:hypothetical protein
MGVEVGNVGKLGAYAQLRILAKQCDRGFEWPEVPGEIEMLVRREMLLGENQYSIFGEGVFDGRKVGRLDWLRQIDIADFGGEAGRDRTDGDRDGRSLPTDYLRQLNHNGRVQAIGIPQVNPNQREFLRFSGETVSAAIF